MMTRTELIKTMARAMREAWHDYASAKDIATAALAAIEAAGCVVAPGWRTMESAPKDGTAVLCWCQCSHPDPDPDNAEHENAVFECAWDDSADDWIVPSPGDGEGGWGADLVWHPTHWQPLPAPPASPLAKDA